MNEKTKKRVVYILVPFFVISAFLNFYLLFVQNQNNAIVKVENQTILTNEQLSEKMLEKYKITEVNQVTSKYLLELEADRKGIANPTEEDLIYLTESFSSFSSFADDIEANREALTDAYYVHEIFNQKELNDNTIQSFLESTYNDKNTKLYELNLFETHDHSLAVEVEELLKIGQTINEVEDHFKIDFTTSFVASMDNFLGEEDDINSSALAHDSNNINHEETLNQDTLKYNTGDVFHIMDSEGMMIAQISKILTFESDPEHFRNLYFSKNYSKIKNDIVNELKGKYVVTYY